MSTYKYTHARTYVRAYMHACIHTYIHYITYITLHYITLHYIHTYNSAALTEPAKQLCDAPRGLAGVRLLISFRCFQPSPLASKAAGSTVKKGAERISLSLSVRAYIHSKSFAAPSRGDRCYLGPKGPNTEPVRANLYGQAAERTGEKKKNLGLHNIKVETHS